jgi:hypothetical protein
MRVRMDDGTVREVGPGEAIVCASGHDAWVVGNEPSMVIDLTAPQYGMHA